MRSGASGPYPSAVPTTAAHALRLRLGAGLPLVGDGSTPWALEQRGFVLPVAIGPAAAIREAPDLLAQLHRDFVAAGVHVLRAETSHTTPRVLRRVGYEYRAAALTSRAVDIALEAAQESATTVAVAGVLEPLAGRDAPDDTPMEAALHEEHAEQAERLRAAGADLVVVQGMTTLREAVAAVGAAASVGLPVVLSLAVGQDGKLLGGDDLALTVSAARAAGAEIVCVEGGAIEQVDPIARRLGELGGAWGVIADVSARTSARRLASFAARSRNRGAALLAGGAGFGPTEARTVAGQLLAEEEERAPV